MTSPVVTVVIPTRNRPEAVARCLDALASQSMPAGSFEVVVVDDGSVPPLAIDTSRWASRYPLTIIPQRNTGPAGARNRGVEAARGECLAFTDDDCLPDSRWLESLVAGLKTHPEAMVGGTTVNGLVNDVFAETSHIIVDMVYEHFNRDPGRAYFFASNNMAVRRDRYLASGGFDAEFDAPAAEDREFCDRWRMQGRPLIWERSAVVVHQHGQTLAGFLRLHWRYGQGAWRYHAGRRSRSSGTMRDDLGFHSALPSLIVGRLSMRRPLRSVCILFLLLVWQVTNALGFASGWLSSRRKPHP